MSGKFQYVQNHAIFKKRMNAAIKLPLAVNRL